MFTRFRQTRHRLQVSLVETRRLNGKVHHEHVASLGSVETPPSVPERISFWLKLHDPVACVATSLLRISICVRRCHSSEAKLVTPKSKSPEYRHVSRR